MCGMDVELDSTRPSPARVYDYFLGGKDNYEVDRQAAQQVEAAFPGIKKAARENRDLMVRATRLLAAEHGIRRFLDLGTGIPTEPNLHQIAQGIAPECRIVYVDNDPMVLAHARAFGYTDGNEAGSIDFVEADISELAKLLESNAFRSLVDEPVSVSCYGLLHFFDGELPYEIVDRIMAAVPPGSYLAISHATGDLNDQLEDVEKVYRDAGMNARLRTHAEISRFFDGLELLDPGVVVSRKWHVEQPTPRIGAQLGDQDMDSDVAFYCGVARKP